MENENPEQQATETTEADLLALAMNADAGIETATEVSEPGAQQTAEDRPAADAEKQKADKAAEDKPEAGKKAETEQKEPAQGSETKLEDESQYSKARKEQERKERSWEKLNEEKAAVRAEREKLETERKELEQSRAKSSVYRDEKGYTAEDYEAFAKKCESDGDTALAETARKRADEVRKEGGQATAKASKEQFDGAWNANVQKAVEANPDLNDESSALGQKVKAAIKDVPGFSLYPEGITHAVAYAKAQIQSGLVSDLQAENQKLKTEVERLNKLTGLNGAPPSQTPSTKSFEEMSDAEREAHLLQQASAADGGIP